MSRHFWKILLFCFLCPANVFGDSPTPWDSFADFCEEKRIGVLSIQFSPCKRWMAATGGWKSNTEGVIVIWDIAEQKCSAFYREFPRNCGSADFTPNGKLLAVNCGDRNVYLFELARNSIRGPEFWRPLTKLQLGVMDQMNLPEELAYSPDGEYLCVSKWVEAPSKAGVRRYDSPKGILVWRTGQWGMLPERIGDPLHSVYTFKFYENHKIVAGVSTAQGFSVHLYDIVSGERLTDRALASLPNTRTLVCPVPQSNLIAIGSTFDQIYLVDHVRQEILVKLPFEKSDLIPHVTVHGYFSSRGAVWFAKWAWRQAVR